MPFHRRYITVTSPLQTPKEKRKDAITQRIVDAAARKEQQHERMVASHAARENAATERQRLLQQQQEERMRATGSRADEAYDRWTEFTRTVSQRAAEKNAKHRSEVPPLQCYAT